MKYFFLALFIFVYFNSLAQENSIFINNYLDPFITNPGCTGSEDYPVAHSLVKKQWLGFPDSPTTFFISGNYRIGNYDFYDPKGFVNQGPLVLKDRVGLGVAIFKDNNGPLSNTGGILSYAYHLPVSKISRLSFGISLLLINYQFNSSILEPDQTDDPYLLSGDLNNLKSNLGIGIYYHSSEYFAGISAMKLLPGISSANEHITESPSYFIFGGYKIKGSNPISFEPSIALKVLESRTSIAEFYSKIYIKHFNWIAISYSTLNIISIQFALNLYRSLVLAYKYEYNLGKITNYNFGSHELSIGVNLGLVKVSGIRKKVK